MDQAYRILVVDDDSFDNDRYCQLLVSAGHQVRGVRDVEAAIQAIERAQFDVVLLDMLLPAQRFGRSDFGGLELLRRIKAQDSTTQVIAVTGYGSRELAAEAMRDGAFDYITKDIDTEDRLPGSVRIAAARAHARRIAETRHQTMQNDEDPSLPSNLIADSEAMRQTVRRVQRLARIDSAILISGEPGVGKEAMATVVHLNSRFASGPFIAVSCGSLSANLIELWGDVQRPNSGYCAQAEGGTLLLKEVQDLPMAHQRQVAEFLRERCYRPVGASAAIPCQVRVVATTTADLERLVRVGRFWRALYNELIVATLDVPPLRERRDKDDILAIAGYLLRRHGLAESISAAAATLLSTYDYPQGNIKELEHILRAAAQASGGGSIQPAHLPAHLRPVEEPAPKPSAGSAGAADDAVQLEIRFVGSSPTTLIWESEATGSTRSTMVHPYPGRDLSLIQRALDAVQLLSDGSDIFTDNEILRLQDLQLWEGARLADDVDQRIGACIYAAVIADPEAKSAFETVRRLAVKDRRPLSLVLRFPPDATDLAGLPWELMWDGSHPILLTRRKLASCIRYLDIPQALPLTLPLNACLRLLIVSPLHGVPDTLYAEEQRLRIAALQPLVDEGLLTIEELRPAKVSDLSERLIEGEPVDVLHFYGHGAWRDGKAYLLFDEGALNASQCATLFSEIPLVVLYACHGGNTGDSNIFTGIAPMLSAEGVPTVIAMQFSVLISAANRFHSFLYRSLARGESVQDAVAKARQALYVEFTTSWYLPVLYIRAREVKPVILVRR